LATAGGGSITPFAGSAAKPANSLTVLSSANAGNTRAIRKLYRKGAFFAENAACARQYAGRQYLSITKAYSFHMRGKSVKITPKSAGARLAVDWRLAAPSFLALRPACRQIGQNNV
jgi:hypothetical protein